MVYSLDRFHCKNCECKRETVLPHSIHAETGMPQTDPSTELPSVVLVCPVCGHGYLYTRHDILPSLDDTPDPYIVHGPWQPRVLLVQIECEEQSCKTPIEVHKPMDISNQTSKPALEAMISRWTLHDATCPNGHPPKLPLVLKQNP